MRANWMTLIVSYLKNGMFSKNHNASQRLNMQSSCFILIRDVLYKRDCSRLYLRCLVLDEANYVMREVHEGVCGNHLGA